MNENYSCIYISAVNVCAKCYHEGNEKVILHLCE